MFSQAVKLATQFTHPLIISTKLFNETIMSSCGTFVVINEEGWIITVAHALQSLALFQQHSQDIKEYENKIKEIETDSSLDAKAKRKRLKRIPKSAKWIINHSFWWGRDGLSVDKYIIAPEYDLAVAKLKNYNANMIAKYPVFKDHSKDLNIGTSLCRLGFPFHNIKSTYDSTRGFILEKGSIPVPYFPIEGIFTRNVIAGRTRADGSEIKFIETSSPGLMGQSGGPIFDTQGTIWGIQSRTIHFPLGFSPKIEKKGKTVEENQFLNVGLGVHPEVIAKVLTAQGIKFAVSNY